MLRGPLITENQLDEWVRGNAVEAQGKIVELVWRLMAASVPNPKDRRIPLRDSIGQPGPDGVLDTDVGFEPFVPKGVSYWEIGTNNNAGDKATRDYRELTLAIPETVRREATFIFVTPLSGRRGWQYTWKEDAQLRWLKDRRDRKEWRDVRVIDGSKLIDWLVHFPAVELWLAEVIGVPVNHIKTPEQHWKELRAMGEPPLTPEVFLINRDDACKKLNEIFSGSALQLKICSRYPEQVADFVAAYIASSDRNAEVEAVGRCLFVMDVDGWNYILSLRTPHVIFANFDLDEMETGSRLLQSAQNAGHTVIYVGLPGGAPNLNWIELPNPKIYQVKDSLERAGYREEQARSLAHKSNGNLGTLLRCLQNRSLIPEWAQGPHGAELAIAGLLGGWSDHSENDKSIIEILSGKSYSHWISTIRHYVLRPNSPLVQRDGTWKFHMRYEGWYALGRHLFDEHLERFKQVTINVLSERDPRFDLSPHERFKAVLYGQVLRHSRTLRYGLAESVALLGSHPDALSSCSFGKPEAIARMIVREILDGADWTLWASLNDLLPLLAEACPGEFLNAVERCLNANPCPFDDIFRQEDTEFMGNNYMTGLLCALETLAWDPQYLTRVAVVLGELAQRDPGGKWTNRPANSLSTIFLPWRPQTCASIQKRKLAVETLLRQFPDIGWKLLLDLLPKLRQVSLGSRRPVWREMIPHDWSGGVTKEEYEEQVGGYIELALESAKHDVRKLEDLVDCLEGLPPFAIGKLLAHLSSDVITQLPEQGRLPLWSKLVDLTVRHSKFSDATWAMRPELVNEIRKVAESLAPTSAIYRDQRLFRKRLVDLYEQKGNYEEQHRELEEKRKKAIQEIFETGGVDSVIQFASSVESPYDVGISLSAIGVNTHAQQKILPDLLGSEEKSLAEFTAGFVTGMFHNHGWRWVDEMDMSQWSSSKKAELLIYLPFAHETWERANRLLGDDVHLYWSRVMVNPYEDEEHLEWAIDHLVQYGRPHAAIPCVANRKPLNTQQAIRVLDAVLQNSTSVSDLDVIEITTIIKRLQDQPDVNPKDLLRLEWAFLPILDRHFGVSPRTLEQRLAEDPVFFCDVIRAIFPPKSEKSGEDFTQAERNEAEKAYRLLKEWRTPPGTRKDGTFDGEQFSHWLEKVKIICSESGHLQIALSMVGEVLIYVPPDPDGLWIHHSVATALDAKDAHDLREGFRTGLFNSRGAFFWSAGREEQELAENYRRKAEVLETNGYYRLANCLRELAETYKQDARREASKDPLDDV